VSHAADRSGPGPAEPGPAEPGPAESGRSGPRRVIIDTDPGLGEPGSDIDDGLAIALALRSPELEVAGLTIVNGNVDAPTGVEVARDLLDRLGRPDVSVLLGAQQPLVADMAPVREIFTAALSGPAGPVAGARAPRGREPRRREPRGPSADRAAAEFLVEATRADPGSISVIAIGPMTNLAVAMGLDPGFARRVGTFYLMAGSATGYAQNMTVVGDFNSYVDPEALAMVLASGARIRMVGIDQTSRMMLTRDDAAALRSSGDAFAGYAGVCTDAWIDFLHAALPNRPEHVNSCFLHDPLVVAAAIDPVVCAWEPATVQVELTGRYTRGLVIADRGLALQRPAGPPNAEVAVDTDVARGRQLILDRLQGRPGRRQGRPTSSEGE
jgi:purine nucleosidase